MSRIHHTWARALIVALLSLGASLAVAQDRERDPPHVTLDAAGRSEVVVDRDCVVNFNARGERVTQSSWCRERQVLRAERADDRARSERNAVAEPRIVPQQNGQTRVTLGRGCEIAFDAEGRRESWSANCGGDDFVRAERAVAAHLREREPRITFDRDGQARVAVGGSCEVVYDEEGRRRRQSGGCQAWEAARADRAMTEYLREREPRISFHRDGQARVAIGAGCEVVYDENGRRRRQSEGCGTWEVSRADRAMAAQLREREPRISVDRSGESRVSIGRDCVVVYDASGRRRAQGPSCANDQVARADRFVDGYWREREPRVSMLAGGLARVAVGRECVVNYDRDGRRGAYGQACNGRELALADNSLSEYRRQRVQDRTPATVIVRGAGDERPGHGQGDVAFQADGSGSVTLSNGCVVNYAVDGVRIAGLRVCNPGQLGRADELMETARQLRSAPRN